MRAIAKGPEPPSLAAHRRQPYSDYDNYAEKDDLRRALVTEQRSLCCYCMRRIAPARRSMKIEHWRCQSKHSGDQLNYRNILASCLGGEGQPGRLQHCDTRKGDRDLEWNPAEPEHQIESRIRYEPNGWIRSDEATFDSQLNDILNLNLPLLRNGRKAVYTAIVEWWHIQRSPDEGQMARDLLDRERTKYDGGAGELRDLAPVAIWLLRQRLEREVA